MTDFSKIPDTEHYVLLTNDSYIVDDGYGNSDTRWHVVYNVFTSVEALKAEVEYRVRNNKYFKVIKSTPLKVTVETKIELE